MRRNPCVFSVTERLIHYTYEFKKRALELHAEGVSPNEIWIRAGFNVSIWKKNYCKYNIRDWRQLVKTEGLQSLTKLGGVQSDKGPKIEGLIDADKVRRLELQVRYLAAENDFLAKLRAKRAESNSGRARNTNSSRN